MTPGIPTAVYLDADAIIRFIEGPSDGLLFLIENAAENLVRLYTSEFTLAEVLVRPLREGQRDLVTLYEELLAGDDDLLTVVPVDRLVLRQSADIRASLGNKGPDAIHVATAVIAGCSVFISSDGRLKLPPALHRLRIDDVSKLDCWP